MKTPANEKFIEAVRVAGAELRSLSREEFSKELQCNEHGCPYYSLQSATLQAGMRQYLKMDRTGKQAMELAAA